MTGGLVAASPRHCVAAYSPPGNSSVPKKFIKALLKDADPRVRATAKTTLE